MRGRGIDFEHRFKTSRWAEDLLIKALDSRHGLLTVRFGLSEVRREGELVYGLTSYKEPDLLVFSLDSLEPAELHVLTETNLESISRLEFAANGKLEFVFRKALAAIEVEFSPYRASEMKDRNWLPRTRERWDKRPLKRASPPTTPNVIVKEEDLPKLVDWQEGTGVPIAVVHLFDQEAFAVSLTTINDFNSLFEEPNSQKIMLQVTSGIFKILQPYNRVDADGAAEKKIIFKVTPSAAVSVGEVKNVMVSAQLGLSASKKYVTHAIFSGGNIEISEEFLKMIRQLKKLTHGQRR
ncbi:MAG: hypothetical protein ACRD2U_14905 [Terriglobales bacterium]